MLGLRCGGCGTPYCPVSSKIGETALRARFSYNSPLACEPHEHYIRYDQSLYPLKKAAKSQGLSVLVCML